MDEVACASTSSQEDPSTSKMSTLAEKRAERLKKMRELHTKRVSC
jgi:hypothetical protein